MNGKGGVPDAWDDDWEKAADVRRTTYCTWWPYVHTDSDRNQSPRALGQRLS